MKITNPLNQLIIAAKTQAKPGEAAPNQSFAALFNTESEPRPQALSGVPGSSEIERGNAASLVGRLMTNRPAETAKATAGADNSVNNLEEALLTLDSYAQALGDTRQTLKDLAPLAEALEPLAERLSRAGREIGDPVLKSLFDQTAVTATVEAMKFKRGDYV